MKKIVQKLVLAGALAGAVGSLGACAYAGVGVAGDKVVIARNDGLLFGAMRKVFVCKISDGGVTDCGSAENP